ncbi:hypothetical protein GCM10025875_37640 [Litorihabitans aurantiacus]|uniref:Uncharacterized protein n=1 Tax=Litorihabitans aurantiacus TaxID=1930061 RepID=A0AA37XII4_9MICO|nr:hypothetical protein GCM10025875_37640 [Litorihabitans aurantiacus]
MSREDHDHVEAIRALVSGGPLAADAPTSTLNNPEWFFPGGMPTPARLRLHRQLSARVWGSGSPRRM